MNPLSVLLWIAAHWWIFAIVAAIALVVVAWSGLASVAVIIKAALAIAAEIAKFFATPANQIAAKILYGFVVLVLGISAGFYYGTFSERAVWKAREAAHAAAMERLKTETAAQAEEQVNAAVATERANTQAAEKRVSDYAEKLKALPIGACGLDDSDLAAGGVRNNLDRNGRGRRPGRLQ